MKHSLRINYRDTHNSIKEEGSFMLIGKEPTPKSKKGAKRKGKKCFFVRKTAWFLNKKIKEFS